MLAIGTLVAMAAALPTTRSFQGLLFDLDAHEPISFALAVALMLAAAMVATLVAAHHAATDDPAAALEAE